MARNLVICGATGFIGRNLAERFVQRSGYNVTGLYHRRQPYQLPGLRWVQADLTDAGQVSEAVRDADILLQAGATTSGAKDIVATPYLHVTDNAIMNSLIFRAAFEHKVEHVVFFSCSIMYHSSDRALKEEDFDPGVEMHARYFGAGWTKVYAERMCEFYSRIGTAKYTVIRHSNVYGPHDKYDLQRSHVTGATVTKVMTARGDGVVVWGDGKERRDLLYVDDLVDFVELAIEKQPSRFGLYNCGSGAAVRVCELVEKIVEKSGRSLEIRYDASQPSIKTSVHLDCAKAERELGWKPGTSLDEGVARTIAWWKRNIGSGNQMA
jgi:nucleoside-diphosphate-sugar epimerase